MSESGPSPEDQEATPTPEETLSGTAAVTEETPAEPEAASEEALSEAAAVTEEMPAEAAAVVASSAPVAALAAGGRSRRRALSWAAVIAAVVVLVLLTTTLLISHQTPAHSSTTGHGTPTAKAPVPLSVYGYIGSSGGQFLQSGQGFQISPFGQGTTTVLSNLPVYDPNAGSTWPGSPAGSKIPTTEITPNEFALNAADGSLRWVDPTPNGAGEGQVVVNGVIYAGSSDGEVVALDAGTGKVLWSTTLLTFAEVQQVADGVVYGFATNDDGSGNQPDFTSEVYALNAKTGKQLWQYDADSVDLVAGGVVYVDTYSGTSLLNIVGVVHALDASTGAERWHVQIPGMLAVQMASNGQLYVLGTQYTQENLGPFPESATHTTLYAVDVSSGAKQWSYPKNSNDAMTLLGVNAGVVDLFIQPGSIGVPGPFEPFPSDSLAGVNAADGSMHWSVKLPPQEDSSGGLSYISGPPVGGLLSNGVIYIASSNDPPSAYNASTGARIWSDGQFTNGAQYPLLTLDLVANGVLYMEESGSAPGVGLYALDASTGKVLWKVLGKTLAVSTVVNGVVYAFSDESNQLLLGAAPASDNGIFALDATTGAQRWSYNLGSESATIAVQ